VQHVNGPNLNNSKQHHAPNSHLKSLDAFPKSKRSWQSAIWPPHIFTASQGKSTETAETASS